MARLAIFLLALVAVAAASKKQGSCYYKSLGKKFKNGATWTLPLCVQAKCVYGKVVRLPCGLIKYKPGCKVVKGNSKAQYPGCCPKYECPKPCYSKALKRYFKDGDKWTEPGCTQAQCDDGQIIRLPCGLIAAKPGCKVVNGNSKADYPGCCYKVECPKPCYSKYLQRFFKDGEKWTEPGCIQAQCDDGDVGRLPCPLIKPGPGCVPVRGKPGAPYPGCCPSFKCPKPGQCYSKSLDRFFDDGAEWTEAPCQRNRCVKGRVVGLGCGLQALRPGCHLVEGKPGAPYPACCPKTVCKCYSKALNRYFKDGAIWTEPPCAKVSCINGNVAAVGCPLQAGKNCIQVEGYPGASYPKCCPKLICATDKQCYSKTLKKIFNDGAKWTEPKCTRAQCVKGKIARLPCPLIALPSPKSGCRLVRGKPGSPYPRCCSKVLCKQRRRCYSKALKRFFKEGQTWSEGICVRATCLYGRIVRTIRCPKGCKGKKKCYGLPAAPVNIKWKKQ